MIVTMGRVFELFDRCVFMWLLDILCEGYAIISSATVGRDGMALN